MIERLRILLESEKLSYSGFADLIGVQRSSISHIMSGRNKPSFDFLQKTLRALPYLNADWIILGEGEMYDQGGSKPDKPLVEQGESNRSKTREHGGQGGGESLSVSLSGQDGTSNTRSSPEKADKAGSVTEEYLSSGQSDTENGRNAIEKKARLERVVLFFDDNSFITYDPQH